MAKGSHVNRGKDWEAIIEAYSKVYENQGHAVVFRTPPPVRLLAPMGGGRWKAVMTEEGPPDYTMLVRGDPRPIAVSAEAKNNQSGRWSLAQLHPHQAKKLQAWHDLGGLAVVLLRNQPNNKCYVLPWRTFGPVWSRWRAGQVGGRRAAPRTASLGVSDLESIGFSFHESKGYLNALLEAHNEISAD